MLRSISAVSFSFLSPSFPVPTGGRQVRCYPRASHYFFHFEAAGNGNTYRLEGPTPPA